MLTVFRDHYIALRAKALADKLMEWLDATTSYVDLKENLDRSWPNYDDKLKWSRFYQYGPVLVADESGILNAEGKQAEKKFKIEVKAVCYDKEVHPGEIIHSRGGQSYMVRTDGSIRKI